MGCEGACRADNDRGGDGNGVADGAEDSGAITVCGSASERRDRDDDAVSGDPLQTEYASASAETLFGTPELWASEQASRWSEDGIDVFSYEKPDSVRRIVVAGLGASAPVCALFWVAALWSAAGRHALTLPLAFERERHVPHVFAAVAPGCNADFRFGHQCVSPRAAGCVIRIGGGDDGDRGGGWWRGMRGPDRVAVRRATCQRRVDAGDGGVQRDRKLCGRQDMEGAP